MKINLSQAVKNRRGETIDRPTDKGDRPAIYKDFIIDCLDAPHESDKKDNKGKRKRGKLADRIERSTGEIELSVDEAKILKDSVDEVGTVLMQSRLYEALGEK